MTFDTHLSMTAHKMGQYWFSKEVEFQRLRNTSGIAVKLLAWTRDLGVVIVPASINAPWEFITLNAGNLKIA